MIRNQSEEILTEPTFEGMYLCPSDWKAFQSCFHLLLFFIHFLFIFLFIFYSFFYFFFLEIEHTTLCVVLGQPTINTDELSLFEAMVSFSLTIFYIFNFEIQLINYIPNYLKKSTIGSMGY